jgi:hypothetical protein
MKDQFGDFIKSTNDMDGGIGLTHVTDCLNLHGIVQSGELQAQHCDVFKRSLLYLFYGKPAYRPRWNRECTTNLGYARVCFILRDEVTTKANRLLPFDSGAFFSRYRDAFHDDLEIDAFDVDPTVHPRKIIAAFYNNFTDYFWMKPRPGMEFPLTKNIVDSYYKLITGGLTESFDDRCASIEVQFNESMRLEGQVLAVIGPNQMFEDEKLMAQINVWGAEPRGYPLPHMFNPMEIGGRLFDEVERFLKDEGYLK